SRSSLARRVLLSACLLMHRRAPISPLFPYTTLFRSTAVPALRALRRAHPGHRFVLAAPARLAGLLPLIGGVDELLDVSGPGPVRSEEHTSELQSRENLVCRLLLEKKK